MTSFFPLSTGTYSISGRRYRKTPFQLKALQDATGGLDTTGYADTPDLYEDEPAGGCLAAPPGLEHVMRKNLNLDKKSKKEKAGKEKPSKLVASSDPEPTEDPRVHVIGGKKWIATIPIPSCFIGKFMGMNRRALNALENETQCRVKTPKRDEQKPSEITSFVSLECVQRCLDRIEIFLDDAKKSARPTHFIAFPCDHHEVQENYEMFKQMVLESEHFDKSCKNPLLFTKTTRLHLTLSVVRVFDEAGLQKTLDAFKIIEGEIRDILKSRSLTVDIQGISMMNDDPSEVSVIYAKVGGATVQDVANHVLRRLFELEISENAEEEVKLHMTLMNARYVAQAENRKKFTFDATKVLEDLKEIYFGTIQINEIALCPLTSAAPADKFYEKLGVMNF